jgi:hypothetical protein
MFIAFFRNKIRAEKVTSDSDVTFSERVRNKLSQTHLPNLNWLLHFHAKAFLSIKTEQASARKNYLFKNYVVL